MKFIFLIAAFNAIFFTVLLLQKRPKALHDKILIFWLIFLGLYIGVYAFYSHELFTHFHLLSISLISLLMLFGPFLYYYILTLVSDKRQVQKKDLLHVVPFVLFNLYILMASFSPGLSEKLNIEKIAPENNPPLLFLFFLIMTAISGTVYFLLTIKLFKKLDIQIFNHFSNATDIDLNWIRKLVLVFGVVWTALISVTVIHHVFHMFSMVFCTDGLFLSLSVFVLLIGYFGLKQKIIYGTEGVMVPGDITKVQTKYSRSRLSDPEAKQLAEQLKKHIESSKSYLNPDLTLSQLATETNMSSHLLSQVINEQVKLNFFDFINQYRVEEFKIRMVDPNYTHFSLLGIALECGFNSKSAYNRIFKKVTGLTPTQYKGTAI
ncbi:MAG: AraC family transcriptional regulator [Porphyromonadaceae bacterium]|nr:MAG: AraC family transcriptional regulator [Porphyromonadaceae bacterium]